MNWQPGDLFFIRFDDKTGEPRADGDLDRMVDEIQAIANQYDFDLDCLGSWKSAGEIIDGERAIMQRVLKMQPPEDED